MKKLVIFSLLVISLSFAQNNGYQVYKKYCASCHMDKVSIEKMKEIENKVKEGKNIPIKAPPFPEVSARIKYFYPEKQKFVEFVVDYITNPSTEKAKCMPMAIKRFGVMPPIGKKLTEEEKLEVAVWLYENYKKRWEDFPMGKMMNVKIHKCDKNCGCKKKREE